MRLTFARTLSADMAAAPQATNDGQACLLVLAQMASVSTKWPKPLLGA